MRGPGGRSYPKVSKLITVCPLKSELRLKAILRENGLLVKWRRMKQYLGDHIGSKAMKTYFVVPEVK